MKKYTSIFCNAKRRFIFFLSLCGIGITINGFMAVQSKKVQSYIESVPKIGNDDENISYDENKGIYTVQLQANQNYKILQLTDIHIGGSRFSQDKDLLAYEAIYELVRYSNPDLIIVTGDVAYPLSIRTENFGTKNTLSQFAKFMDHLSIPWAFTPGNHDCEILGNVTQQKLNGYFEKYAYPNGGKMLYSATQPNITGLMNQIIEIKNADQTMNQLLFLIDSNSYIKTERNKYDYIHDDQVEWYESNIKEYVKNEGSPVSSMMFFHIPLEEYKKVYDLYMDNSNEVQYYFGENKEGGRKVCCSKCCSNIFEKAVELGSTKAMFAGHDHYNNISLGYKGIRLTYGMSIDYLTMHGIAKKTEQRGATLITLHPDSQFDIEQIKLKDIQT